MHPLSLPLTTGYVLAAAFAVAGLVQVSGIGIVRCASLRWNYPPRIFRLTGSVELLAAILLASPSLRPAGVALGALVNFMAVALLLKNRAYLLAVPGMAAMVALPLVLLPVT